MTANLRKLLISLVLITTASCSAPQPNWDVKFYRVERDMKALIRWENGKAIDTIPFGFTDNYRCVTLDALQELQDNVLNRCKKW